MSKVIPKEQLSAYERWELPAMGEHDPQVEEMPSRQALPTAQDIERIFQEARAEGLALGREAGQAEGFAAGFQQGMRDATSRKELLESLINSLARPLTQSDEQVSRELLALALEIARFVIRAEIRQQPERLLDVIREAMNGLPVNATQVQVILHPEDAHLFRAEMPDMEAEGVRVLEDANMERGGCRILADSAGKVFPERRWHTRKMVHAESEVDARIEQRWREALNALLGEELVS